jgi:hypothetical protein
MTVFVKDAACVGQHPARMLDRLERYLTGRRQGVEGILCLQAASEDGAKLAQLTGHTKPQA